MSNEFRQLLQLINNGNYANIYILEGEEAFYIEQLVKLLEEKVIPEEEKDFNLMTLYGNEVDKDVVINECMGFPMFGERKLVLLRNAASMKSFNDLEAYFKQPMASTIIVVEYKGKKLDKRSKLYKIAKEKATIFSSEKIKDWHLAEWIKDYGKSIQISIPNNIAETMAMYLGNDLQKISNEIEKIKINIPDIQELTPAILEEYIGISKEYNMFELSDAFFKQEQERMARMLAYFNANPKNAPMPPIIASFYTGLSKALLCHYEKGDFNTDRKLGIWQSHRAFANRNSLYAIHKLLVLLEEYSHKAVGVESIGTNRDFLLKEMIGKMNLVAR